MPRFSHPPPSPPAGPAPATRRGTAPPPSPPGARSAPFSRCMSSLRGFSLSSRLGDRRPPVAAPRVPPSRAGARSAPFSRCMSLLRGLPHSSPSPRPGERQPPVAAPRRPPSRAGARSAPFSRCMSLLRGFPHSSPSSRPGDRRPPVAAPRRPSSRTGACCTPVSRFVGPWSRSADRAPCPRVPPRRGRVTDLSASSARCTNRTASPPGQAPGGRLGISSCPCSADRGRCPKAPPWVGAGHRPTPRSTPPNHPPPVARVLSEFCGSPTTEGTTQPWQPFRPTVPPLVAGVFPELCRPRRWPRDSIPLWRPSRRTTPQGSALCCPTPAL
jgi:hypothetical protein